MVGPDSTSFTYTVGPFPPIPAAPEPRIGPGMILERGRTRIAVMRDRNSCGEYMLWVHTLSRWRNVWGAFPNDVRFSPETHLRVLLLSGFRIVRPADEESAHAK